jgi:MoaA/NifB/PqqE/SkfB family radical SAM enzyme
VKRGPLKGSVDMALKNIMAYLRTVAGIWHGARAFGGPLMATIELTHRCNIQCRHCNFFSPHLEGPEPPKTMGSRSVETKTPLTRQQNTPQPKDADISFIHPLIDEFSGMGTRRFSFSGHGEPFLHKDLFAMLDRVKSAGGSCTINTNGTRLNKSTIDDLIKIKADDLRISTLAGTRAVYSDTHPGISDRTFDDITTALHYLAERKQALGIDYPRVRLICVVFKTNQDHLVDFAKFAADVQADSIIYTPMNAYGFNGLSVLVPAREDYGNIDKQLDEVKTFLRPRGIDTNADGFRLLYKKEINAIDPYTVIPCYYGWLGVRFDTAGDVYLCCRAAKPFGNAAEEGFTKIWNSAVYAQFRKQALQINQRKTPVDGCLCASCPHRTANMQVYEVLHPLKRRHHFPQGIS